MRLRTDRLLLRPWLDEDLAPYARLNADPRVMECFPATLTREQSDAQAAKFRAHIDEHGWGFWAVEVIGGAPFIGFMGIRHAFAPPGPGAPDPGEEFVPCIEIGYRLAAEHWGRGYATESGLKVLDFAFTELGLDEVVGFTSVGNTRSRRVMEKIGMTYDPTSDFDHPRVEVGHPLRPHVVYRVRALGRVEATCDASN